MKKTAEIIPQEDENMDVLSNPPQVLSKSEVIQTEISSLKEDLRERELREEDLTRKKLFRVVSEAMEAEEVLYDKETGKEVGRTPDHEVRLKAAREAREILGETAMPSKGRVMPNIIVYMPGGRVAL